MNATTSYIPRRLRFAPSPTGSLHVGGARTALFNALLARRWNGRFILRIEDTDASRNRPESEATLLDDLHWLGVSWDEGPDIGGPFGPYRQSERFAIYHRYAERLAEQDRAYPCFCTSEELEREQAEQRALGIVATRYSGRCASLDETERAALRASGRSAALRLRIPPGQSVVEDLIHGSVTFDHALFGDPILQRGNGTPTYNFAAAIDDALMEIDLVVRGDEHLANTPMQLLVLAAIELPAPRYAHLPLILNEERAKLSKRHQTVGLANFRAQGYLPEALINHLALLGWSPGEERETFTFEELSERFGLDRVGRSPAVFNEARLRAFNARAIRALPPEQLRARVGAIIAELPTQHLTAGDEWLDHFIAAYGEGLTTFGDVATIVEALFAPPPIEHDGRLVAESTQRFLRALLEGVRNDGALFTQSPKSTVAALTEATGVSMRTAYQAIRIALTGSEHGAPLVDLLALLGRERVIERLTRATNASVEETP